MKCKVLESLLEAKERVFRGVEEKAKDRIVRLEDQTVRLIALFFETR